MASRAARAVAPAGLAPRRLAVSLAILLGAVAVGTAFGPATISPWRAVASALSHLPLVHLRSGLSAQQSSIVWDLRLPRVVLGVLVGGMLASSGAAYQGVFSNPLADPYLLGAAAGASLGVTIVVASGHVPDGGVLDPAPVAAFAGALLAAFLAYAIGAVGGRVRTPATLLLAGVAVMSFLTALQTYVQQQHADTIRTVYDWILGRLTTASWSDVVLVLPYFVVTSAALVATAPLLDLLSVGDEEAASLGVPVRRVRLLVVATASLATAAAVSVSGLIGFVGIVVPHTIRLTAGASYRAVVPLSIVLGGSFLALADLFARTALSPAEIPIGVVTAFVGAPFFVLVLRTTRGTVG